MLPFMVAATVCGAVCCSRVSASALDALYGALDRQRIEFSRASADLAAVTAALASVDARASVVVSGSNGVDAAEAPVLTVEHWEQGIGYLGVPVLSLDLASNIVDQVSEWQSELSQGIILDLRGAGGDSLEGVDVVAGLVVSNGVHLYDFKNLQGEVRVRHMAVGVNALCRIPLVILTDAQTCDAAEVLAAALKKQGGVMLVGGATLGDATVRAPVTLTDDWAIVVASGKICLGEACSYDGTGVVPDVPVEAHGGAPVTSIDMSSQQGLNGRPLTAKALQDRELMKRIGDDLTLRRAADILLGLKALGAFGQPQRVTIEVTAEDDRPEDK